MKFGKMLVLAGVVAALMAFVGAGTASAEESVVCSTTTEPCGSKWAQETTLDFSSEESIQLKTTGGIVAATCSTATIKGKLTGNPDEEGTATIANEAITWGTEATPCTKKATTIALGALKIKKIAGTSNGTVIADSEIKVTYPGLFSGETCNYGVAAGTSLGTLTEGKPATFDLNAVAKQFPGHSCFFGPETTLWTGKFTLTEPASTTLSVSAS